MLSHFRPLFAWIALSTLALVSLSGCTTHNAQEVSSTPESTAIPRKLGKVLVINSYHLGFPFSDGEQEALFTAFGARLVGEDHIDDSEAVANLRLIYLDSKHHPSGPTLEQNVAQAWQVIDDWKPDVIMACDDNAVRLILDKLPENSPIKGVYCGVNYSADAYDLPPEQITGMIEVIIASLFDKEFKKLGVGTRVGYLAADSLSNRKDEPLFQEHFGERLTDIQYFSSLDDFSAKLEHLQSHCDSIILGSLAPVINTQYSENWYEGLSIIQERIAVPIAAVNAMDADFALLTLSKNPHEQGAWAGKTAIRLLQGTPPTAIPSVKNQEVRALVNSALAKQLNIRFNTELLQHAKIVGEHRKRVLYINSYHKGCAWGDALKSSTRESLATSNKSMPFKAEIRSVYMDSKRQKSAQAIAKATHTIQTLINQWKPDLVISADCNAIRQFGHTQGDTPLIYTGLNDTAYRETLAKYATTGMTEASAGRQLVDFAQEHFQATKVGYLGPDTISSQGMVNQLTSYDGIEFHDGFLVNTNNEWIEAYRKLNQRCEVILLFGHAGITDWDKERIQRVINTEGRIPTLCTMRGMLPFSTIGKIKIPEELGWWAGEQAALILNGADPRSIPPAMNKSWHTYVSPAHLRRMSLSIPTEILTEAHIIRDDR